MMRTLLDEKPKPATAEALEAFTLEHVADEYVSLLHLLC